MMLFAWPALWIMAGLLWRYGPKSSGVHWAGWTAFAGGSGAMSAVLADWIIPFFEISFRASAGWVFLRNGLYWLETFSSVLSQWGLPFAFLQFAMRFSGLVKKQDIQFLQWVSLLPIGVMLLINPPAVPMNHSFQILLFWTGPYLLTGILLLLISQWMEPNHLLRMNRRFTNLITIPLISFHLFSNYLMRALQIEEVWQWNGIVVWVIFAVFVWLMIKKGVFGIRLHAEQQRHDWSWQAVKISTSSLHHAIKGEVHKLNWLTGQIHQKQPEHQQELIQQFSTVTGRLEDILSRMYRLTADFQLREEWQSVRGLVQQTVERFGQNDDGKSCHLLVSQGAALEWHVDGFHLTEVLSNLLINAYEAIGRCEGTISISWQLNRRTFRLTVQDDGCGIPETDWRKIFQPYYSTKAGKDNLGFGLFYAYEVIQRHQGWIEVFSKPGEGTAMTIVLPARKVRKKEWEELQV